LPSRCSAHCRDVSMTPSGCSSLTIGRSSRAAHAGAHWRGWSAANPRPVQRLVRQSYSAASSSYSSSTESERYERWE
jgi:hypothetical protein